MQAEKLVFISSMATPKNKGGSLEEMNIFALYEAAMGEEDGVAIAEDAVALDVEDQQVGATYSEQIADEL